MSRGPCAAAPALAKIATVAHNAVRIGRMIMVGFFSQVDAEIV
jgi:hypothetical protein